MSVFDHFDHSKLQRLDRTQAIHTPDHYTGDVNVALLDPDTATDFTNGKIFIHELLDRKKYRNFLNIKYLTQKLGFKYIWHQHGNILVKSRGGDKSHVVSTPADLRLFGVAETHLQADIDDRLVEMKNFSILRVDRKRGGGGIALYVHNSFKAYILVHSKTTGAGFPGVPEYMICSVQQRNFAPILVSVIYRPPHIPFCFLVEEAL